jgi:hypothetical protein
MTGECIFPPGEHDYDGRCCNMDPKCTPVEEADKQPTYEPPPSHYDGGNGIDGWAIVDAFGLDFYLGNAVKYIIRCGKKDIAPRLDDLKKARNYINKAIEREEGK